MLSSTGKIIFGFVLLAAITAFTIPVLKRIRIVLAGIKEKRFNNPLKRLWEGLTKILFQRCTLKDERLFSGLMHVFIFYSALTFDTMTINHVLEGFFPDFYLFGNSGFGLLFSFLVNVMAILVLIGVAFFAYRRFIIKPKAYRTTLLDSAIIYFCLTMVTLSYLYFEVFAVAAHPETQRWSFLGVLLGKTLGVSALSSAMIHKHLLISWWAHIITVLGFIVYVPYSKYFHMFAGSLNVFLFRDCPTGELKSIDLENTEVFGVEKAIDLSRKDLLDEFACMECGRCQDACPAFATEKALSPKMIIFNLKRHLLKKSTQIITKKRDDLNHLMDGVFTKDEIWACTTCGACMHVCPVEIEHIPKIVGARQGQVLMESQFPQELNAFFRNMETNSNPWGIGFADRGKWAEDLNVKHYKDVPDAEYLFWIGCAGSYDEQGTKITKAMVSLLNKAGISFGILGSEEKCCGDSAKRLGNEYLFQMSAGENLETFKKYKVKKILLTCPHGYNTFKHEYPKLVDILPQFSDEDKKSLKEIEVIHYIDLLQRLIDENKLKPAESHFTTITYHDSCYNGRHNNIINGPREILSKVNNGSFVELQNHKQHSFCCGAGGGLMWTEENQGTRINHKRIEDVVESGADCVATSCPFCQTMFTDGLKDKDNDKIKVLDLAQILDDSQSE